MDDRYSLPPDIAAALERARLQVEALAQTANELQVVLPDAVGAALRDGLREEAAPISRRLAEVKGLSNQMVRRLERLLDRYGTQVAGLRLSARGVSPQVLEPVKVDAIDLSTAASRAALALATLPIFLLMATFIGGMNVAIDTTAGERERGSLESLLVHAVPRRDLVIGKWLAAVSFNLLSVVLTLLFCSLVLRWGQVQKMDVPVALSAEGALRFLLLLLPLVLLAPALQMLLALFARSFKEAQTQLSLLMLLPMLPGLLLSFQSFEPKPWMRIVPILAEQILMRDLLYGKTIAPAAQALTAGATLGLTVACLGVTARLLHHERIVLGR